MGIPPDILQLVQSGGGALVVTVLLGFLTWCSKRRDSLHRAERELRTELRGDIAELKRLNDDLEKGVIELQEAKRACLKEHYACQEEILALKEAVMKIKTDFWTQYSNERARDEKKKS